MTTPDEFTVSIEALVDREPIETVYVTPEETPSGKVNLSTFFSSRVQDESNGYRIKFNEFDLVDLQEDLQEIPGVQSVFVTPPYEGDYSHPTHILSIQDISVIDAVIDRYPIGTVVSQTSNRCEIIFSPKSYLFNTEPQ